MNISKSIAQLDNAFFVGQGVFGVKTNLICQVSFLALLSQ